MVSIFALAMPAVADTAVVVTSLIPEQQFGAGRIELQGDGFGGSGSVTVGGVRAPIARWNETRIVARVPVSLAAGQYPLRLQIGGKTVFERPFLVKPRIVDISVTTDKSGTAIRAAGTSLLGIAVEIAGIAPRYVSRSNEELVMAFPPGLLPGMHRLKITVAGHEMESSEFEIPKLTAPLGLSISAIEFRGVQMVLEAAVRGATGVNPPTVTIDGKPAEIAEWKPSYILVNLPVMEPGDHVVSFSSGGLTSPDTAFRLVYPVKAPSDPRWDEPEFEEQWDASGGDAIR